MSEKRVATIYDYVRFSKEFCAKDSCANCLLSSTHNSQGVGCGALLEKHTDEYNEILLKWIDEHPIKTYKDDFFEHFPNASKNKGDYPEACRQNIYGGKCNYGSCETCWYQPYKESEDEE